MERIGGGLAVNFTYDPDHTDRRIAMRGYTLIETVIVISIIAVLSLALGTLFIYFNHLYNFEIVFVNTEAGAGAVVTDVETYARNADHALASKTINGTAYVGAAGVLVLEVPSIDASQNAISNKYDYVAFYKSSSNVYRDLQADTSSIRVTGSKLLSDEISSIAFTYSSGDFTQVTWVKVDVTAQNTVRGQTLSNVLHEQIYLRNISL